MSFGKQQNRKDKAEALKALHGETRQRLIAQFAPPPGYRDLLRVMPVDELERLSDPALVTQALLICTTDNKKGSLQLDDGSTVKMRDVVREFADNSKSLEGNAIKRQLKERKNELTAVYMVFEFINGTGDEQKIRHLQ